MKEQVIESKADLLSRLNATADKLLRIAEETDSAGKIGSAMRALSQTLDIIERVEAVYTGGENERLLKELMLELVNGRVPRADMWRTWLGRGGTGYTKGEFFKKLEHHGVRFVNYGGTPMACPPERVKRTGKWPELAR